MKNLLKIVLPALALSFLLTSSASAQSKIATIDLRVVFDKYWKTAQATAALKNNVADLDKEDKKLMEEYKSIRDGYEKLLASANDSAIALAEKEKRKKDAEAKLLAIKDKEQEITQFRTQARTTLESQKARMRDDVLKEIREAVNRKAKSAGFAMVLDSAAESFEKTPFLMFNSGENDITKEILDQLNETAPADLPKPAEKTEEKKPGTK